MNRNNTSSVWKRFRSFEISTALFLLKFNIFQIEAFKFLNNVQLTPGWLDNRRCCMVTTPQMWPRSPPEAEEKKTMIMYIRQPACLRFRKNTETAMLSNVHPLVEQKAKKKPYILIWGRKPHAETGWPSITFFLIEVLERAACKHGPVFASCCDRVCGPWNENANISSSPFYQHQFFWPLHCFSIFSFFLFCCVQSSDFVKHAGKILAPPGRACKAWLLS